MTYRTHIIGGVLAALLISKGMGDIALLDTVNMLGVSTFAAITPDMWQIARKQGRRKPRETKELTRVLEQSGVTHAPLVYGVLFIIMLGVNIPITVSLGFLVGAISHILLDMFNIEGVPLMLPITRKRYHITDIKRGSGVEVKIRRFLAVVFLFLMVNTVVDDVARFLGII